MRFEITNNINNRDNVNIALISGTRNITFNNSIQINNMSNIYTDNLAPIFTDAIIAISDDNGIINSSDTNNKFRNGVYITDRYVTNKKDTLTYPLWFKYNLNKVAMIDRLQKHKHIEYNIIHNTKYNISLPNRNSILIVNTIKVYRKETTTSTWEILDINDYIFDINTMTIIITNENYDGNTILIEMELIDNKIIIKNSNGIILDTQDNNIVIEGIRYNNIPISTYPGTDSNDKYIYLYILSNKNISGSTVTYNSDNGNTTEIINYTLVYRNNIDYTIDDDYNILTNKKNTQFYISYDPATTILRIEKDNSRHMMPWFINIPDNKVEINGKEYEPTEKNILSKNRIVDISEPVMIIDNKRIKLTYDLYIERDINNKPINISLVNDDIDLYDYIEDVIEKDNILIVKDTTNINPSTAYVKYQTKFNKNIPIPFININPYKIYGEKNGMIDYVIIMLPKDELTTNQSVFAIPVNTHYKYTDDITNKTLNDVLLRIANRDIANDIQPYINTNDIHPIILGITKVLFFVSPNDIEYIDSRRLGTDIAYDYNIDEYTDNIYINYTTVGWWWGKPIDLDNIAVVYIRRSTIEKMKELYYHYDYETYTNMQMDPNFNLDSYIMKNVIKPKIKKHLRVGSKLILEIVDE